MLFILRADSLLLPLLTDMGMKLTTSHLISQPPPLLQIVYDYLPLHQFFPGHFRPDHVLSDSGCL